MLRPISFDYKTDCRSLQVESWPQIWMDHAVAEPASTFANTTKTIRSSMGYGGMAKLQWTENMLGVQ